MKKKLIVALAIGMVTSGAIGNAIADNIYVIEEIGYHGMITAAINDLAALGHAVTSNTATLADYSSYDQVWDLRYSSAITSTDVASFTAYMQAGGNMYLTGEWSTGFDGRNNSVESFLSGVGAGTLDFTSAVSGNQSVTVAGQVVNSPNVISDVNFGAASLGVGASINNGFLVTEYADSGTGSLLGWDFGDISSAMNARLLVGLDIEIFQNGSAWTENMATYLGASGGNPVPEPTTMLLFGAGLAGLVAVGRRCK